MGTKPNERQRIVSKRVKLNKKENHTVHIDKSIRNFEPLRGGNGCLVPNLSGDISQY